jgi:hypothetical protein
MTHPDLHDVPEDPPEADVTQALRDLQAAHPADIEAVTADVAGRFEITDDRQATWAMRKARDAARRIKEVEQIAEDETERIQAWAINQRREPEATLGFFRYLLESYALRERQRDPKRKSISTPYGKVQTRENSAKFAYDDEAFIAWAKAHDYGGLVKIVEKVKAADAAALLRFDGETETVHTIHGEPVEGAIHIPANITATTAPEV